MIESPNFIGSHFYTIDAKNRLAVPSKFRLFILRQKELILFQGLEGCLNLCTQQAWTEINEKLGSAPLKNRAGYRAFKRMLFANACEVEFDDEGRILIPQHLLDYAQLKKEAAIVGHGQRIEIWAQSVWNQYVRKNNTIFKRYATQLEI